MNGGLMRFFGRTAVGAATVLALAGIVNSTGVVISSDASATIDPSQYSISLTSSGTIALRLETVPNTNVIRAGKDTVTATITAPTSTASKFRLLLSTDSTTSNDLTNGTSTIAATSGTITSPTALTGNSWGYALANTTTGITTNGFDSSYTTPDPGKTSKWAGVPTQGNE